MSIILVGFMTVGKSTVGKELARKLNRPFIDLDDWIESQEKKTINEIFNEYGENYFRQCEYQALKKWQNEPVVIATGGGIVSLTASRNLLTHHPNVIGLDLARDKLIKRLNDKKLQVTRPLLRKKTTQEILVLYQKRMKNYRQVSNYWLTYNDEQTDELVEKICLFYEI